MTVGETIWLQRPSEETPWGFRLGGGRDYKEPIKIQRVTVGTIASRQLATGDLVLRIGHEDTGHLTQAQANELIKHCGNCLQLCVARAGNTQSHGTSAASPYSTQSHHSPHTPGTPGSGSTPGSAQVVASQRQVGDVHDLFQDMYRQSDQVQQQQHGVTTSGSASVQHPSPSPNPYLNPNQNLHQNPQQVHNQNLYQNQNRNQNQNLHSSVNQAGNRVVINSHNNNFGTPNTGAKKFQTEKIGPFFPGDTEHTAENLAAQTDSSLNSSVDSGIGHGQNSFKFGSPKQHNPPQSVSSSQSELSDATHGHNNSQCNMDDSLPSPPPPFSPTHFAPNSPSGASYPPPPLPTSPPPPLPSSQPPSHAWKPSTPTSAEVQKEPPRTRLEQQLAELNMSGYMSPTGSYPGSSSTGTPGSAHAYHSPTAAPGAPGYHPLAGVPPPPPPMTNTQPHMNSSGSPYNGISPRQGKPAPSPVGNKPLPDKIMNMAAKSGSDKKPFSYAPDMGSLTEQRDKVRRKPQGIPAYQNMLNLPNFNDPPVPPHIKQQPRKQEPESPLPSGPGQGTFAHAQYNSPLQLYSNDSVQEAFQGQTGGVITAAKRGQKPENDITQSETYKLIHGLDAPKKRPTVVIPSQPHHRTPRQPADDDEMTFTGVNRPPDAIPSKAFHRLQHMTEESGGAEIDRSSIRPRHDDGQDGVIGGYDEASIRYMGRNIPSKSFRMLQNLTGGAEMGQPAAVAHKRRPQRKPEPDQPEPHADKDDIASMSYVGGNIPSKSFKMLQQFIGEPESSQDHSVSEDDANTAEANTIPGGPPTNQQPADGRRQRRRQINRDMHQPAHGQTTAAPIQEEEEEQRHDLDEQDYLQGKVSILSEDPKVRTPKEKQTRERAAWEIEAEQEDERRINMLVQEPFRKKEVPKTVAPWEARRKDEYPAEYNAQKHLPDIVRNNAPARGQEDEEHTENERDFDEAAFLAGKVPLVSCDPERAESIQPAHYEKPKKFRERAPWEKPDSDEEDGEQDTLAGKIALSGNSSDSSSGRFSKIPSRTFNYLRRSVSRDTSPGSRAESLSSLDYVSAEEADKSSGSEEPIKNLVYKGKSIPSKTFHRLRLNMDKHTNPKVPSKGDFERLRQETRDTNNATNHVENVQIETKQPEEYLKNLKESMQNDGVRIEEAEATDF